MKGRLQHLWRIADDRVVRLAYVRSMKGGGWAVEEYHLSALPDGSVRVDWSGLATQHSTYAGALDYAQRNFVHLLYVLEPGAVLDESDAYWILERMADAGVPEAVDWAIVRALTSEEV